MTGRIRRHPLVTGVLGAGLVLGGIWVAKLVQLARSSSTHAAYWSQPQGEAGGLLYAALGDSAAQGIGASDPQHGYVALLAARLRQASGRPVEVVNLSSSGARIGDVLGDQVPARSSSAPRGASRVGREACAGSAPPGAGAPAWLTTCTRRPTRRK